jgi:hypothetical protein
MRKTIYYVEFESKRVVGKKTTFNPNNWMIIKLDEYPKDIVSELQKKDQALQQIKVKTIKDLGKEIG